MGDVVPGRLERNEEDYVIPTRAKCRPTHPRIA